MFNESPCNWQRRGTNRSLLHGWRRRAESERERSCRIKTSSARARWHGARSRRTQGRRPSYTEMAKKYVIGCVMLYPGRLWCSRNLKDKLFRPSTRYRYRSSSVPLPCHVEKFHPSSERMLFVRACVFLGPLASLPLLGIKFGQLPPPTQNFLNLGVDNLTKCGRGRGKEATATGGRRIALSSN